MSDFVLLPYLKDISVFNANSVDSDQTPRPAASDLDLYCLPMSLLWDSRYKLLREIDTRFWGGNFNIILCPY